MKTPRLATRMQLPRSLPTKTVAAESPRRVCPTGLHHSPRTAERSLAEEEGREAGGGEGGEEEEGGEDEPEAPPPPLTAVMPPTVPAKTSSPAR